MEWVHLIDSSHPHIIALNGRDMEKKLQLCIQEQLYFINCIR